MSQDLNTVTIVGRLTRDAELRYTNSGFCIGNFSIACNDRAKEGETWVEKADFFDCKLLGKRAESLGQYLVKGGQVAISGRLKTETWEKEGQRRSKVLVLVNDIQLLGGKQDGRQAQVNSDQSAGPSKEYVQPEPGNHVGFEDDIPF